MPFDISEWSDLQSHGVNSKFEEACPWCSNTAQACEQADQPEQCAQQAVMPGLAGLRAVYGGAVAPDVRLSLGAQAHSSGKAGAKRRPTHQQIITAVAKELGAFGSIRVVPARMVCLPASICKASTERSIANPSQGPPKRACASQRCEWS